MIVLVPICPILCPASTLVSLWPSHARISALTSSRPVPCPSNYPEVTSLNLSLTHYYGRSQLTEQSHCRHSLRSKIKSIKQFSKSTYEEVKLLRYDTLHPYVVPFCEMHDTQQPPRQTICDNTFIPPFSSSSSTGLLTYNFTLTPSSSTLPYPPLFSPFHVYTLTISHTRLPFLPSTLSRVVSLPINASPFI